MQRQQGISSVVVLPTQTVRGEFEWEERIKVCIEDR